MKKYNDVYYRPTAMNMVEDGRKIWITLINRNGICEIDKFSHKAIICKVFDDEPIDGELLYCHTAKIGNLLVFSPGTASKIAIYDLNRESLYYIPLQKMEFDCKQNQNEVKFWNILQYHSDIYLLGHSYPAIIKINIESMETLYITDWVNDVENEIENGETSGYFGDGHVIINDMAFIPLGCINAVLELNFKTDCTKLRKLRVSMKGIGGLSSADGKHIWMVGKGIRTNRVACWNKETNEIKEFELADLDETIFDPFFAPICIRDKVIFMPASAPYIYEIDTETEIIEKKRIVERGYKEDHLWKWWNTMAPKLKDEWLTYLTCDDLGWHEYNIVTGESKKYYIHLENTAETERYFDELYLKCIGKSQELLEKKMPLKCFLDKVNNKKIYEMNTNISFGEKIHEKICKGV